MSGVAAVTLPIEDKAMEALVAVVLRAFRVCKLRKSAQTKLQEVMQELRTAFAGTLCMAAKANVSTLFRCFVAAHDEGTAKDVLIFVQEILSLAGEEERKTRSQTAVAAVDPRWCELLLSFGAQQVVVKSPVVDLRKFGIHSVGFHCGPFKGGDNVSAALWVYHFNKFVKRAVDAGGDGVGFDVLNTYIGAAEGWLESFRAQNPSASLQLTLQKFINAYDEGKEYALIWELDKGHQGPTESVDAFRERMRVHERHLALHNLSADQIEVARFVGRLRNAQQVRLNSPATIEDAMVQARILDKQPTASKVQDSVNAAGAEPRRQCFNWRDHGKCKYGATCKFWHGTPDKEKKVDKGEEAGGFVQIAQEHKHSDGFPEDAYCYGHGYVDCDANGNAYV
jgi:hypothetical protein